MNKGLCVLFVSFSLSIPILTLGLVQFTFLTAFSTGAFRLESPASLTRMCGPLGSCADLVEGAVKARKDHLPQQGSGR